MGRWYFSRFLFLLVALSVNKANGFPARDLVKELPGQPKVGFRQFAGYGATSENSTKALFYYFVEAEGNATRKPLTLWLNGGPGCSSVGGGAFTELGPFFPKGDGRGLRRNRLSWNKASNLLFVDSPVGVGWSYSNLNPEIPSSDASSAEDLYLFLLTWYENFPAFKNRDLFLTGESYAGHYIPQLAELLLNHNMRKTSFKFKIKGIALGNSLLKASSDITARYNYLWSHGMISAETGDTLIKECDFEKFQYVKPHNLSEKCNTLMDEADQAASDYTNQYNVLLDVCYPAIVKQELQLRKMASRISLGVDVCMEFEIENYLNLIEVQKALHVTEDNQTYSWKTCNDNILYKGEDGDNNMLPLLKRMVQNKIPVLIFSGDQDAMIPLFSSRKLVKELAEELKLGVTLPYGPWFHKTQVGGWQIEYGNILTFATVRGGSHMVPLTQPSRALHLFKSFIYGRRLPNRTFPMDAPDAVEYESTEGEVELSSVEN